MNLLQGNSVGDVSLESIEVMAQALGESLTPQEFYALTGCDLSDDPMDSCTGKDDKSYSYALPRS